MRDDAEAKRWEIWADSGESNAGMSELVLARSNVAGIFLPKERRALVRAAGAQKVPIKLTMRPRQPDPRLPTFREVREKLGG